MHGPSRSATVGSVGLVAGRRRQGFDDGGEAGEISGGDLTGDGGFQARQGGVPDHIEDRFGGGAAEARAPG